MMAHWKIQLVVIFVVIFIPHGYARAPRKILRGHDVSITELPHQVSLQTLGQHFCGGTIISSRYILTAAHCIVDDIYLESSIGEIEAVTGTNDRLNRTADNVFHVTRRIRHAHYSWSDSAINDIAILEVDRPIPFNKFQKSANLPRQDIPANTKVISSGWGATVYDTVTQEVITVPQHLRKMESTVLEQDECEIMMIDRIYPKQLCIWSKIGNAPCNGDSGGPITYNDTVVGITSWGEGCGEGYPDVGTRVHKYLGWIQEVFSFLTANNDAVNNSTLLEVMPLDLSPIGV